MARPLDGTKILDFTRFQNGPHATVMLADLGAEVLKVEQPGLGDMGRSVGRQPDGFCGFFEAYNRGKKSMTLDVRRPEAKNVVRRLVREYDVVTENFRPDYMDSLGIGYEELRRINPRVIYGSASAFGSVGPWRDAAAYDLVAQGFGGVMVTQGGGPGERPEPVRFTLADHAGSLYFAYAVLAAIVARLQHGVGQKVESSLLGAQVNLQSSLYVRYLRQREQPSVGPQGDEPPGMIFGIGPLYSWYQAADGKWLALSIVYPKPWPKLCRLMGLSHIIEDPRCATPEARRDNASWLYGVLAEQFRTKPREHWLNIFLEHEIPGGPVNSLQDACEEDQIWLNGYLVRQKHSKYGEIGMTGIPYSLSETAVAVGSQAPDLGRDTEDVLTGAGFSREEVAALADSGVI